MPALRITPRVLPVRTDSQPVNEAAASSVPPASRQRGDAIALESPASGSLLRSFARERFGVADSATEDAARRSLVHDLLAHVPAADRAAAKVAIPAILDAARESGSSDPNLLGYLLATAQTESDFGANMVESGHSKAWFNANYGSDDGNRPGTDDGYTYRGRGYVQTTHAGRYAELSHHLQLADVPELEGGKPVVNARGQRAMLPALVADPARLADPELAARALVIGVEHNLYTHNPSAAIENTIPAGMPPGAVDFYHARAIVNGIVKEQADAVADQATIFAQILSDHHRRTFAQPDMR